MKSPQGREAKKPKKSKATKPSPILREVDRHTFKVPAPDPGADQDKS